MLPKVAVQQIRIVSFLTYFCALTHIEMHHTVVVLCVQARVACMFI